MIRYLFWRQLPFIVLVLLIVIGVTFYIIRGDQSKVSDIVSLRTTIAVQTAVANALFDATRTAEAPQHQYRVETVLNGEPLYDVAQRYQTTVEVLRMANGLRPDVDYGDGSKIIIPEGVTQLLPPRTFSTLKANPGDTLQQIAKNYGVDLALLEEDNPILATRGVNPGDTIFIPKLI